MKHSALFLQILTEQDANGETYEWIKLIFDKECLCGISDDK